MKIKTGLGTLQSAIEELEAYKEKLEAKTRLFSERLAEIGVSIAAARFKTAQYDGENDVVVESPYWQGNKLIVASKGNAVTFIEFGTGIRYAEIHPKAAEMGATRGGYGKGKGNRNAWVYYGAPGTHGRIIRELSDGTPVVMTHGNPPAKAMYESSKAMRASLVRLAKEVFCSD